MKKRTKIWLFAISAALIIGVICATAIASAASVTGVTVKTTSDFESAADDWAYTASDKQNPRINGVVFQQGGRVGAVKIQNSLPYENNKYVLITQEDMVASSGPYVWSTTGARPTTETLNNAADDMSKYSYYAFDVDVMAPTGKFIAGNIDFSARYANSAGTVTFWNNSAIGNIVQFSNDSTGSYIYLNGAESTKKYIDPYEFTHITCILETKVTSSSYSINTHVYVNGEYFSSKTGSTTTTSYYNSVKHASIIEYRINYLTTVDSTVSLAIDNPTFRTFDKTYNGNLATVLSTKSSLYAWESNIYDVNTAPVGIYKAYNETTRETYLSVSDAISAAKAGEVVHVVADCADEIVISKAISINPLKGDGTASLLNLSAASGYTLTLGTDGCWKCESTATPAFQYVSGGVTMTADKTVEYLEILGLVDSGSTIKLLSDVTIETTAGYSLYKNLTIDLNGKALTVKQAYKATFINVQASRTLTVKNGTLIAEYYDGTIQNAGYPVFGMSTSSVINIENVNTYCPQIAWNYGSANVVFNIVGGEHHQDIPSSDVAGGLFESRSNATFTATDATFYLGSAGRGLFSSLHYRGASLATKKSTFTFNNCKIIGATPQQNIITYANEYTFVNFNNCDILGSINPPRHEWDVSIASPAIGEIKYGNIKIGEGCRISENSSFCSEVVTASGYALKTKSDAESLTFDCRSGSLEDSNFTLTTKTVDINYAYAIEAVSEHTITWYASNGKTVIKTEKAAPGAIVTPPEYTASASSGWYTAEYDGWATSLGGEKVTDFTVGGDTDYYPAISGEITANLTTAGYNISLVGAVAVNFYLPIAPDGITMNGVFDANGNKIFPTRVVLNSKEYDNYLVGIVGATEITKSVNLTVSFYVGETLVESALSLSPYKYARYILNDSDSENPQYTAIEYALIADMLRYSNNLIKYVNYVSTGNASANGSITRLFNAYASFATELPTDFSDMSEVDTSALVGYVTSATFEVSSYQPAYKFYFPESAKVVDCYVTMEGYYSSPVFGANYGEVTYKSANKQYYSGTEYLSSVNIPDIPMYNIDNTVTINVLLESGMLKTGTFNLNGYYNGVSVDDATLDTQLKNFIKSLRAFSTAAVEYRYDTVVTVENAVDFRTCDHESTTEHSISLYDGILPLTCDTHYCATCDSYLVRYSDFGVTGDGKTNDFAAIRRAHIAANALQDAFPVYNVVASSGVGTFYIGMPDDGGVAAISVKTDVDWDGAHFIIDDTVVDIDGDGYAAAKQSIFALVSDSGKRGYSCTADMPDGVAAGATNVGFAPGELTMISLKNVSVRHYIRQGLNENSGAAQTEMILVDAYGNIDPTTPVEWDYTNSDFCTLGCETVDANSNKVCDTCSTNITKSFSATRYTAADAPIIISGLDKDGNINCVWETWTNDNVSLETYNQYSRNISVTRSNTTIEGIDRVFVEDDTNSTPRQTYSGVVNVSYSYNTTIKDFLVNQHLSHYQTNGALLGSYEFSGSNSINTSWINCKIKNFFDSNGKVTYRGMFGTNYMRNSYLKGCVLTSFDSHTGAYNVTIEDSTFEHINYVGGGEVIMRNVTVYVDGGYGACILRQDYGSMWKGDIKMDGITLRHSSSYSKSYIDLVRAAYTNWYFGFTTHLPGKIYANNIKIEQYTRTSADYEMGYGTIVEPTISTSTKTLGIHQLINSQMKNDYDYSTANDNNLDPKVCTEAVYITNTSATISYPDHWFYKNMKVYIDGVEQNWFKVRSGLHTDSNGDKVCDNGCGQPLS